MHCRDLQPCAMTNTICGHHTVHSLLSGSIKLSQLGGMHEQYNNIMVVNFGYAVEPSNERNKLDLPGHAAMASSPKPLMLVPK